MPVRGIALAAALAGSLLCPLKADALGAQALITHCATIDRAQPRGLAAIRKACPGIGQAVASLQLDDMLPEDWQKAASPAALAGLAALAKRYDGTPGSILPAASDLRAIALGLQQPRAARSVAASHPVWDRIKAWLRRRLAPLAGVLRWLHSLPGWTGGGGGAGGILLAVASVLILIGVAAFVFRELRVAGLYGGWRRRLHRRRRPARARLTGPEAEEPGDPDRAHAPDQPASALRMLLDALRRSQRIERDGNLTSREILAQAVFDTQGQREKFASIALLAERQLFGPSGASVQLPDELRSALGALYMQLSAAPAARPAAT